VRRIAAIGLALLALGACGGDDEDPGETGSTPTTEASTTSTSTAEPSSTTAPATATTEPPAAADPVAAAQEFLDVHFPGHRATLGEFQQGDSQSGEIEVLRPNEGGGTANVASTLLLRLDEGGYQVIGAVSPNVTIDSPENGGQVDAGPTIVSGVGRGFEATLVATAFANGEELTTAIGTGGAQAEPVPYEIELDLAPAASGTELVIVVAGGVGLEGDTGEFSAVRVTVA
jgi:hypothetical protein